MDGAEELFAGTGVTLQAGGKSVFIEARFEGDVNIMAGAAFWRIRVAGGPGLAMNTAFKAFCSCTMTAAAVDFPIDFKMGYFLKIGRLGMTIDAIEFRVDTPVEKRG